jgi:hypothetical protein
MLARVCEKARTTALGDAEYLVVNGGVVHYIFHSFKRAFSRSGEYLDKSFAPTLMSVPMTAAFMGVVPLLAGIIMGFLLSSDENGSGSPGKNPSFSLPVRATMASLASLLWALPWMSALAVVRDLSCVVVGGRQGSGLGWWMCIEAAALKSKMGQMLHGVEQVLAWLG